MELSPEAKETMDHLKRVLNYVRENEQTNFEETFGDEGEITILPFLTFTEQLEVLNQFHEVEGQKPQEHPYYSAITLLAQLEL